MKPIYYLFFSMAYVALNGCASIVSGQNQVLSVNTPYCVGARCTMTNPGGVFYVTTPGTVSINREYDDLVVSCEKAGVPASSINVKSSTKGMAFGNILFGGLIGTGVDVATGAAYDYPAQIVHPLDCRNTKEKAAAPKVGRFDEAAKALVDLENCEVPAFVFLDGESDVYKSRCIDGTIGVIGCRDGECSPMNVATIEEQDAESGLPNYSSEAQQMGRERNCTDSFHASDVTKSSEVWMAKCSSGAFLVIHCEEGACRVQE